MMRHGSLKRHGRGQSTAEYAVLFAIVIGAAIAMQSYVKGRLQGAIAGTADGYMNAALKVNGYGPFEPPNRTVGSLSGTNMSMTGALAGQVNIDSASNTIQTK